MNLQYKTIFIIKNTCNNFLSRNHQRSYVINMIQKHSQGCILYLQLNTFFLTVCVFLFSRIHITGGRRFVWERGVDLLPSQDIWCLFSIGYFPLSSHSTVFFFSKSVRFIFRGKSNSRSALDEVLHALLINRLKHLWPLWNMNICNKYKNETFTLMLMCVCIR